MVLRNEINMFDVQNGPINRLLLYEGYCALVIIDIIMHPVLNEA